MLRQIMLLVLVALLAACSSKSNSSPDNLPKSEIIAAWERSATPGDEHRLLEPLVGSWDAEVRYWTSPHTNPEVSKASAEAQWILGGRFIEEHYSGTSMGRPIAGRGIFGHDNIRNIFTSFWIDNMSTAFMMSSGTAIDNGKTLRFNGTFLDPVTSQPKRTRSSITIESANRHVFEMYDELENGSEFKTLEIIYSRRGT